MANLIRMAEVKNRKLDSAKDGIAGISNAEDLKEYKEKLDHGIHGADKTLERSASLLQNNKTLWIAGGIVVGAVAISLLMNSGGSQAPSEEKKSNATGTQKLKADAEGNASVQDELASVTSGVARWLEMLAGIALLASDGLRQLRSFLDSKTQEEVSRQQNQ